VRAYYIDANLEKVPLEQSESLETKYLLKVFDYIKQVLPGNNLEFYVTANKAQLPEYKDKIVFLLGDEHYTVPTYYNKVKLIFKNYFGEDIEFTNNLKKIRKYKDFNIYGMPLPPVAYYNEDFKISPMPFEERPIDILFRGNGNSRPEFYSYITEKFVPLVKEGRFKKLKCNISFGTKFRDIDSSNGRDPTTFVTEMAISKICLCPRGTSVETFRHTEALRSGCIIISEKLPEAEYYKDCPFYIVDKQWTRLPQILDEIFNPDNEEKNLNMHKKMLQLWEDRFSEKAVANNIVSIVKKYL
tara:strand:+ start:190 stop:1089 length:900 start_codon:yes stop_codon:yes gene_type:complete